MDLGVLGRANPPAGPDTFTAIVVRADESGLWVVEEGGDPRSPVGPCRGGWTANGTRTPVGAVVALTYTETDPWVIGFDNPALAVNDATFAPFPNSSFETPAPVGWNFVADRWSDFWSAGRRGVAPAVNTYTATLEEGAAAHGLRAIRVDARGTYALINPVDGWGVPPGSSLEVSFYGRADGPSPDVRVDLYSHPTTTNPGPFGSGVAIAVANFTLTGDWLRHRAILTIPATHANVLPYFRLGATSGTDATVWIDNVDVDLVEIDPAAAHQDFMRRAALVLAGGGTRTVTAGGNVSWSQAFTIAGVGFAADEATAGRFEITQPPNGTVIPVRSSSARTSHTVAGGVIALNPDDALWYELPLGAAAASQPGRFHIVGSTSDDGFVVPPHWILVVRRTAWSASAHGLEYRWGDGAGQDPWRTPALNAGWVAGTLAPRYTKTASGLVVMRGRVASGAGSAFTLPAGYVPTTAHDDIVRDGAGAPGVLTVTTGGVVTTSGSNADHSIATTFAALGG